MKKWIKAKQPKQQIEARKQQIEAKKQQPKQRRSNQSEATKAKQPKQRIEAKTKSINRSPYPSKASVSVSKQRVHEAEQPK